MRRGEERETREFVFLFHPLPARGRQVHTAAFPFSLRARLAFQVLFRVRRIIGPKRKKKTAAELLCNAAGVCVQHVYSRFSGVTSTAGFRNLCSTTIPTL